MEGLVNVIEYVSTGIALIGGFIIVVGVLSTAYRLVIVEIAALRHINVDVDRRTLRHHFGYYLLLGLEFLIAADILRTLIHPGMEELITLGVVVLIRTIVSVTLNWELSRPESVKQEHP